MPVIRPVKKDIIQPRSVALSPLNLYIERVRSVSDNIRFSSLGYDYIPLQLGGIKGQQQSLLANSVISLVDFQVGNDQ